MLRLVPFDERLLGLAGQPDALSHARSVAVGPVAEGVREVLMQSAAHSAQAGAAPGPEGFLAIDDEEKLLVGTCDFVHPPDAAGQVEIAYLTFPPRKVAVTRRPWRARCSSGLGHRAGYGFCTPILYREPMHPAEYWRETVCSLWDWARR